MKLLRTLTLLLTGLLFTLSASAQKTAEPIAYRLVDSVGRPVTFDKLITRAAGADVVFFRGAAQQSHQPLDAAPRPRGSAAA